MTFPLKAWLVALLLLGLPLAIDGCKSQAERQLSRDVARIAHRVNELRNAPNNAKLVPLEKLREEPCEQAAVCELQTLCVQAYSLHVKSIQATSGLRERLRSDDVPAGLSAGLVLEAAEKDLKRSRTLIQRCLERQGELERNTQR